MLLERGATVGRENNDRKAIFQARRCMSIPRMPGDKAPLVPPLRSIVSQCHPNFAGTRCRHKHADK